jgi:hypothetical protein
MIPCHGRVAEETDVAEFREHGRHRSRVRRPGLLVTKKMTLEQTQGQSEAVARLRRTGSRRQTARRHAGLRIDRSIDLSKAITSAAKPAGGKSSSAMS